MPKHNYSTIPLVINSEVQSKCSLQVISHVFLHTGSFISVGKISTDKRIAILKDMIPF